MDVNEELTILRKLKKKSGEGSGRVIGVGLGGAQGDCKRRIEVIFVAMQK